MKKVLVLGAAVAVFALPLTVSAAWDPRSPLVPQEVIDLVTGENSRPQAVTFCHLVQLSDNLVSFAVYLAVLVATVVFAYAGFLYVTASAHAENLNQAKGIFGKVLLGLIFVLVAWLIVNLIMGVFLDPSALKFPWNGVRCDVYAEPGASSASETGEVNTGKKQAKNSTATAAELANEIFERRQTCLATATSEVEVGSDPECRIAFNKDTTCGKDQRFDEIVGGCTNWRDVQPEVRGYIEDLANECECDLVVTGGSEKGHDDGPYSHEAGYKVDLRNSQGINTFVEENPERFERLGNNSKGELRYRDKQTGATWTKETGTDPHWDVCAREGGCSSGS